MVNICSVYGCKSNSNKRKDLKFHRFPRDARCLLWIHACQTRNLRNKNVEQLHKMHICSLHFEEAMYKKNKLITTAVPALNLPATSMHFTLEQTEVSLVSTHPDAPKVEILEDLLTRGAEKQIESSIDISEASTSYQTSPTTKTTDYCSSISQSGDSSEDHTECFTEDTEKKAQIFGIIPRPCHDAAKTRSPGNLCFCCLAQYKTMINIANCEHNGFLHEYFTIRNAKALVCEICHNMLVKISIFKKQVAESNEIMNSNVKVLQTRTKLYRLDKADIIVTSTGIDTEYIEYEVKHEIDTEDTELDFNQELELTKQDVPCELGTDIKIKEENAYFENTPLDEIKTNETQNEQIELPMADLRNESPSDGIKTNETQNEQIQLPVANYKSQYIGNIVADLKNESSSNEIKTNETQNEQIELPVANKKSQYIGKIVEVLLSTKEMMEERRKESNKHAYMIMPFKCETCIKGFSHEIFLKTHNDDLHNMNKGHKYLCNICKKVFFTAAAYRCHTKRHSKRFVCIPCGKRSANVATLTKHFNKKHGDALGIITTEFKCRSCEYSTDLRAAYNKHLRTHRSMQCNICNKTFASRTCLKVHVNTVHKGIAQYPCLICDRRFTQKKYLIMHTELAHKPKRERKKAYCEKCNAYYADSNVLKLHLRNHSAHITDEKKFGCQDCDAKFVTRSQLKYHVDWDHLKLTKYKCKKCSKAFKTPQTLKRHGKFVHEKKRPPRNKICDYCGLAFFSTTILILHIRTHTGDRPEKCMHCDATFAHSAALYNHNRKVHKELGKIKK